MQPKNNTQYVFRKLFRKGISIKKKRINGRRISKRAYRDSKRWPGAKQVFSKFAEPLVRPVFPTLITNKIYEGSTIDYIDVN